MGATSCTFLTCPGKSEFSRTTLGLFPSSKSIQLLNYKVLHCTIGVRSQSGPDFLLIGGIACSLLGTWGALSGKSMENTKCRTYKSLSLVNREPILDIHKRASPVFNQNIFFLKIKPNCIKGNYFWRKSLKEFC